MTVLLKHKVLQNSISSGSVYALTLLTPYCSSNLSRIFLFWGTLLLFRIYFPQSPFWSCKIVTQSQLETADFFTCRSQILPACFLFIKGLSGPSRRASLKPGFEIFVLVGVIRHPPTGKQSSWSAMSVFTMGLSCLKGL